MLRVGVEKARSEPPNGHARTTSTKSRPTTRTRIQGCRVRTLSPSEPSRRVSPTPARRDRAAARSSRGRSGGERAWACGAPWLGVARAYALGWRPSSRPAGTMAR
jgi:hypothetical protein